MRKRTPILIAFILAITSLGFYMSDANLLKGSFDFSAYDTQLSDLEIYSEQVTELEVDVKALYQEVSKYDSDAQSALANYDQYAIDTLVDAAEENISEIKTAISNAEIIQTSINSGFDDLDKTLTELVLEITLEEAILVPLDLVYTETEDQLDEQSEITEEAEDLEEDTWYDFIDWAGVHSSNGTESSYDSLASSDEDAEENGAFYYECTAYFDTVIADQIIGYFFSTISDERDCYEFADAHFIANADMEEQIEIEAELEETNTAAKSAYESQLTIVNDLKDAYEEIYGTDYTVVELYVSSVESAISDMQDYLEESNDLLTDMLTYTVDVETEIRYWCERFDIQPNTYILEENDDGNTVVDLTLKYEFDYEVTKVSAFRIIPSAHALTIDFGTEKIELSTDGTGEFAYLGSTGSSLDIDTNILTQSELSFDFTYTGPANGDEITAKIDGMTDCSDSLSFGQDIDFPITNTCTDSDDGEDYYTVGTTIGTSYYDGTEWEITDSCNDEQVVEYSCPLTGNYAGYAYGEAYDCSSGYSCYEGACIADGSEPSDDTNVATTDDSDIANDTNNEVPEDIAEIISSSDYTCEDDFVDTEGHWAQDFICRFSAAGIVVGFDDYFLPSQQITRAETLKIIMKNMGVDETRAENHEQLRNDVSDDDWYSNYVKYADYSGWLLPGENFRPNEEITRWEAVLMLIRAHNLSAYDYQEIFPDVGSDEIYAYAIAIANAEVIQLPDDSYSEVITGGDDGYFNPNDLMTRAEAIGFLFRAYLAWDL
jgi:hypothetical protein